ncbi:hypothetical protein FRB94_005395 [Tulasnella sp. JGI-2019a]|nr:hypothetical protein FRB94_005395 [Tulasnella sp. JGI-2019a]KAG9007570.1 hypothetical protein FRB93_007606 [Tulasnella sp. JGI-2019a]KAG9038058.1 hypothetical protein FRB95_002986 [Tulasnella sp. JGI-2019a]
MPLYEILCISSHATDYSHISKLVKQTALTVLNNGGVVRTLNCWGTRKLPALMKRQGQHHTIGDYWTIHFDASPTLLRKVNFQLQQDPRVIRWTTTKLGEQLKDIGGLKEVTVKPGEAVAGI